MSATKRRLDVLVLAPDERVIRQSIEAGSETTSAAHLISCLMISRGEIYPTAFAIECFQRQTFQNKELVIVTANTNGALKRYVESLGDHRIRYSQVPDWSLGTLRNISVGLARGDLVATWDDDDLRHPRSLEFQYAGLTATPAAIVCLMRLSLWEPARQRLATTEQRPWENSLLGWKYQLPEYPSLDKREDTHLMQAIAKTQAIALMDVPELYVYAVHGKNTWESRHFDHFFSKATTRFEGGAYDRVLDQLNVHVPIRRYAERLQKGNAT